MRGLYIRGVTAGRKDFGAMLDKMTAHGINAAVLDAKDYDGFLTYPSRVAIANETGAIKDPPIDNLAAKIREIHQKGIRVIMRISCFHDEIVARNKSSLSIMSKAGRPYRLGWTDPSNPGAQQYIKELVRESIDAGADEIELDYVRYPVVGIHNADFQLKERGLTQTKVITAFVHDVHAITRAHGVPLSLDIFGVVAFGKKADIDGLGQDPALLAAECEVLSPMVYPSHYTEGFAGFDVPADHPEIVGTSLRLMSQQIASVPHAAILRPWLQAVPFETPHFSASWVAAEARSSDTHGGSGWLMWNPGQGYGAVWAAVQKPKNAPLKNVRL